jgi:hypothetical protein
MPSSRRASAQKQQFERSMEGAIDDTDTQDSAGVRRRCCSYSLGAVLNGTKDGGEWWAFAMWGRRASR